MVSNRKRKRTKNTLHSRKRNKQDIAEEDAFATTNIEHTKTVTFADNPADLLPTTSHSHSSIISPPPSISSMIYK